MSGIVEIAWCPECGAVSHAVWQEWCTPCGYQPVVRRRMVPAEACQPFVGDEQHPDQADYIATNLLAALDVLPDTGDWYQMVRSWCLRTTTGKLKPNRSANELRAEVWAAVEKRWASIGKEQEG